MYCCCCFLFFFWFSIPFLAGRLFWNKISLFFHHSNEVIISISVFQRAVDRAHADSTSPYVRCVCYLGLYSNIYKMNLVNYSPKTKSVNNEVVRLQKEYKLIWTLSIQFIAACSLKVKQIYILNSNATVTISMRNIIKWKKFKIFQTQRRNAMYSHRFNKLLL